MSEHRESPRNKMWPLLFRTIIENIENTQSVSLKQILDMINKNLTFDNPGLFSSNLIIDSEEQLKEKSVNIWLLNQLIYSITKIKTDNINNTKILRDNLRNNISLQKEILSACILKQSWLFKIIIEEYIKLIELLIKHSQNDTLFKDKSSSFVEIKAFHIDSYQIEQIYPEAVYHKFRIDNNKKLNLLLECCIEILKHAISLDLDSYNSLYKKCLLSILNAYNSSSSFTIKFDCIEFFQMSLFQAYKFDKEIFLYIITIIKGCLIIVKNLNVWLANKTIKIDEVIAFSKHLMNLLKSIFSIKFETKKFYEDKLAIQKLIIEILINLHKINDKFIENFDNIEYNIIKYLSLENGNSSKDLQLLLNDNIDDLLDLINRTPKIVHIFLNVIIIEIISNSENIDSDLHTISSTWNKIYEKFLNNLSELKTVHHDRNKFENEQIKLKFINEVIKLMNKIDYEITVWHQKQHIEQKDGGGECNVCTSPKIISNNAVKIDGILMKIIELKYFQLNSIEDIVITLEKIQNLIDESNSHIKVIITEISGNLLQSNFFLNLKLNQQMALINLIIQNFQQNTNNDYQMKFIMHLININAKHLKLDGKKHFQTLMKDIIQKLFNENNNENSKKIQNFILHSIISLVINETVSLNFLEEKIIRPSLRDLQKVHGYGENMKNLICLMYGNVKIFKVYEKSSVEYKILCLNCSEFENESITMSSEIQSEQKQYLEKMKNDQLKNLTDIKGILIEKNKFTKFEILNSKEFECIFNFFTTKDNELFSDLISSIPSLLNHLNLIDNELIQDKWLKLILHNNNDIRLIFSNYIQIIQKLIMKKIQSEDIVIKIFEKFIKNFLQIIDLSLNTTDQSFQSSIINLLLKFSTLSNLPEKILINSFRMTFLYLIRYESCVSHEAILCALEICSKHNVTPNNLLNWHKHNVLKLIITLCVSMFLRNGIGLNKSLSNISKMLGFTGSKHFIAEYYKLFVAMLLPWCIKNPKCKDLLNELANLIQEDLSRILALSFLTTYPYLFINETDEINGKCLEFIIQNTGKTLYTLLYSDIKRTIPEILIYYHKAPKSVMNAFRYLLLKDNQTELNEISHLKIAEYITTRFLGVITYFESCLIDPDFEKILKFDILLSLGEIMRFIGTKHITPFRFKILAMLRTALTIKDTKDSTSLKLKDICINVWNIFIHTVDIQALGPLLSTIIVSLESLLDTNKNEIHSIYKFLIISNGSLLSRYIPDLYFIETLNVTDDIKIFVKDKTEKILNGNNFIDKLKFFLEQIKHENIIVRQYGLKYLTKLFIDNRNALNNLMLGKNNIDPIIEDILTILMINCRHIDKNLQLASGKCLGELGAIEPSHLPPNYSPQKNFSLSIHQDDFAIMALKELCKAYQFQKDTKYVDSFSLAIQEILAERGVCPESKKKMDVWEAIPERMRQLMQPLLTSCYTSLKMNSNINVHPIFGSSKCQTYEEWAFLWASKMITEVQNKKTQDLLNSFKPSIKRDTNILSLFLPYIILHAIQSSNDEFLEKIYEEFECVFKSVLDDEQTNDSSRLLEFNKTRMRGLKTLNFLSNKNLDKHESEPAEYLEIKCAKMAFEQLDFLGRWLREWNQTCSRNISDCNYTKTFEFLNRFNKKMIAVANFNCSEYFRALMYIESYIEGNSKLYLQDNLSFLAKIYAKLMDPDSLEGAIGLKKDDLTISEQILVNNMTDRHSESITCFEKLMQTNQIDSIHVRDIVQCYLNLDTPETALLVSEGLFNQLGKKYTNDLKEIQAEPLWRLGRFEDLEELINKSSIQNNSNWGIHCGKALISFRNDNQTEFEQKIEEIRFNILTMLRTNGVAELNAYQKGYPQVMELHTLSEIEKIKKLSNLLANENHSEKNCINQLNEFLKDWKNRLSLLQPTPRITEPLLCLRRILLKETKALIRKTNKNQSVCDTLNKIIDTEIGKIWIQSTELTRKAGWYQQAQLCIMNAEEYEPENLFLEKAKLLWKKGDQTNCFKVIEQKIKDIEEILNSNSNSNSNQNSTQSVTESVKLLYAEAKFLQASYNAESMNISTEMNKHYFKQSLQHNQKSEKCLVHLAQYMDKIYASMSDEQQESNIRRDLVLFEVMNYYGRSMYYGCEFIYQSMPRLLSIWLDFTAQMKRDDSFKKCTTKMNEFVEKLSQCLPSFIFYTTFSQLISRICHPSLDVYNVLKTIIICLIKKFPQQSLWMILPAFKSSYANRVKRCTEIFNDRRLNDAQMQTLINDFNSLAERLIELTNKEIPPSEKHPTVSSLVPKLQKLLNDSKFSQIIMPFQQFMQPTIPPIDERSLPAKNFNAFPNKYVYIKGIKDEVTILISLQRPRKVALIGSDGKEYTVMMKPKDDLRKDFRLMEFNAVVKQYLHQDPEARQRRLSIRTYAVLPLNEECGLIEWVQNLHSFRQILIKFYKQKQLGMNGRELKAYACKPNDPIDKKREVFLKVYLPRHPTMFGEWFKLRFTNPHNWYQARTSYIRTTAVMSIVGYILGLGDRHGENILFDGMTGDIVHVDFNCLFNKGETFDYPENIPFRLTHNMVHAMGPLGIEGAYRKCCEITMRVLQSQTPTLMSVLRPFVYDSVVNWNRTYKPEAGNIERIDPQAIINVNAIEERLKGYVKIKGKTSNMPLSTEGQVNYLISQATDIDNLAAMYIGWGPFL